MRYLKNLTRLLVGVGLSGLLLSGCTTKGDETKGFIFPGGSFVAVNDTYQALGNATLNVTAAQGVLVNDTAGAGVTAFQNPSALGGTVAVNADGSFTYTPPVGVRNQADTFTYNLAGSQATVTVNLSAGLALFVNNTNANPGDGSQVNPFNNLAAAVAAAQNGDTIFLFRGDGNTTNQAGAFTIPAGVSLIGEGIGLNFNNGINPREVLAQTIVPAGNAPVLDGPLTVNNNVTISGVSFTSNTAACIGGQGSDLTISNNSFANTGGAGVVVISSGTTTLANNMLNNVAGRGLLIQVNGNNTLGVTLSNNTCTNVTDDNLAVDSLQTSTANVTLTNNTITAPASATKFDIQAFDTSTMMVRSSGNTATGGNVGFETFNQNGAAIQRLQCRNDNVTGAVLGDLLVLTGTPGFCLDMLDCTFGLVDFGNVACDVERFDLATGGPLGTVNAITTIANAGSVTPRPAGFCGF